MSEQNMHSRQPETMRLVTHNWLKINFLIPFQKGLFHTDRIAICKVWTRPKV